MFLRIELGILSGPEALLLPKFLRHRLYVSRSKYVCSGICGSPRLSMVKPSWSCHGYRCTLHVHCCGCIVWYSQVGTVGRLLMDCCMCISFAMSSWLVRMLFCLSMMELRGEVSEFLKTFLFIFLGFFSYSCLYFDTALSMHSLVYFVVMSLACFLAVFAITAILFIHVLSEVVVVGGLGICTCW